MTHTEKLRIYVKKSNLFVAENAKTWPYKPNFISIANSTPRNFSLGLHNELTHSNLWQFNKRKTFSKVSHHTQSGRYTEQSGYIYTFNRV